ncbi:MAG: alpha/beta hydrolase [Oscillospiraceae bacterium]|nr:alpha/beta hydrolase [Oscillospiraceae bacterium]
MSVQSRMIRFLFTRSDNKRDAGLCTPDEIIRSDDICYGDNTKWQVLDVYRPKMSGIQPLPVIVSVHGGGWVYGDKERYQYYCMDLARRGFAVVNFTYRLAPRHKFPASLEDTSLAFSWVSTNAKQYGLDLDHVFAVGDSAGAHLLGLYCCMCVNPEYARSYSFAASAMLKPNAIALNCGIYEIRTTGGSMNKSLMKDVLPEKGTDDELEQINVLRHMNSDFPPVLYMTCSGDFLQDQAALLGERLHKLQIPSVSKFYGDKDHILPHVFHCDIRSHEAARCNDEECAFFRSFLSF